jgi:hypothetical protein
VRTQEKFNLNYDKQRTKKKTSLNASFESGDQIENKEIEEDADQGIRETMKNPKIKQIKTHSEIYANIKPKRQSNKQIVVTKKDLDESDPKPKIDNSKSKELDFSILRGSLLDSKQKEKQLKKTQEPKLNPLKEIPMISIDHEAITTIPTKKASTPKFSNKNVVTTKSINSNVYKKNKSSTNKSIVTFVNAFETDHLVESIPINSDNSRIFRIENEIPKSKPIESLKVRTAGNSIRRFKHKTYTSQFPQSTKFPMKMNLSSKNANTNTIRSPVHHITTRIITKSKPSIITNRPAQVKYIYRSPSPVNVISKKVLVQPVIKNKERKYDKRVYMKKSKKKTNFIAQNINRIRELSESRRKIKEENRSTRKSKSQKKRVSMVSMKSINTYDFSQGSYK